MTNPTAMTLRNVLEHSVNLYASLPALSSLGANPVTLTYSDLYEAATRLSHLLAQQGIGYGDKVAILSESCPHWGVSYFAITGMGAVAVPILTEFHADAVQHIVRHSEAKAVIVSSRLLCKIEDLLAAQEHVFIAMEDLGIFDPSGNGKPDPIGDWKNASLREFRKVKDRALRRAQMIPESPGEDDVAVVVYTSGTTGHSKGVVLTHKNIVFDATIIDTLFKANSTDRLLSILPLAHTYECTVGLVLPISNGAHISYLDKPPTARVLLPAFAKLRPTIILSVPLVIEKMFKTAILPKLTNNWVKRRLYSIPFMRRLFHAAAGKKLLESFGGCLRAFPIGGAGLSADVEQFLLEASFPYAMGYGLTETAPLVAGAGPGFTKHLSTGKAVDGIAIRLDNPDLMTGEGEILVKGANVMREYFKAPDITAQVFTEDGWLRTGDLGKFDSEGFLYIKGRLKNVLIGPSGENIYPEEIEGIIGRSLHVLESLVYMQNGKLIARVHLDYARLDETLGEVKEEAAQARTEAVLETIRLETNRSVSSFSKVSKVIEQREPFEKTPTLKIKRYLYIEEE